MLRIGYYILAFLGSVFFPVQPTIHDSTLSALENSTYPSHHFPLSFVYGDKTNTTRARLGSNRPITVPRPAGVTAIVLNWSRLDNVVRIASLLCDESLQDIIAEVFIWNNSPQELNYEVRSCCGCPKAKLRLYNSPRNLYFYARFLACTQARTPFCFVQDDDYLVLPQIVRSLEYRITNSPQTVLHLLPAHEHLSSRLRTVTTSSGVHTGFAWLGHGTMLSKKRALDFVSLLRFLDMPQDEVQMADNYFTILGNQIPEIWFDHGIELGGGQPFTIGQEGHERNQRHIKKACAYLDRLVSAMHGISQPTTLEVHPFVEVTTGIAQWSINRTPCLASLCLLETNVHLLDDEPPRGHIAADLMTFEEQYFRTNPETLFTYTRYSLSRAVDGIPATEFRSPSSARRGEYVMLDILSAVVPWDAEVELVFLIPWTSEEILRNSDFQSSVDGEDWISSRSPLICRSTSASNVVTLGYQSDYLVECNVQMAEGNARFFKATLELDASVAWAISEVWLRTPSLT
ncbi:hypothetical protein V8B97DRAFT_640234 [Scleroderma yunnanense]